MFGLISKLAEILSSHWGKFLDGRRLGRDVEVARHLVGVVVALHDLCVRGERVLVLAERLTDGDRTVDTSEEFTAELGKQVRAVDRLRSVLDASRELLATTDGRFYVDLAPLVDQKSGMLARWSRHVVVSVYSPATSTLFFLPADELTRLLEIGQATASTDRLDVERTPYVNAVAEGIRAVRRREVRDIRLATGNDQDRVRAEIVSARADLARAKDYSSTLLAATEAKVGAEAFARLRRTLLP